MYVLSRHENVESEQSVCHVQFLRYLRVAVKFLVLSFIISSFIFFMLNGGLGSLVVYEEEKCYYFMKITVAPKFCFPSSCMYGHE